MPDENGKPYWGEDLDPEYLRIWEEAQTAPLAGSAVLDDPRDVPQHLKNYYRFNRRRRAHLGIPRIG